jgi:hypothetical protein
LPRGLRIPLLYVFKLHSNTAPALSLPKALVQSLPRAPALSLPKALAPSLPREHLSLI